MITVKIGDVERTWNKYEADWVNQQIQRRKEAGDDYCVMVSISMGGINFSVFSGNCHLTGGGGRSLSNDEKMVLDLWNRCHLNTTDFTGGNLVAFLQQLEHQF